MSDGDQESTADLLKRASARAARITDLERRVRETRDELANERRTPGAKPGFRGTVEYRGRAATLAAWGRELGIPASTLKNRLFLGWSVARAFEMPPAPKPEVANVKPPSTTALARQHGISVGVVYARLKLGWSLKRALETPVRPQRSPVKKAA